MTRAMKAALTGGPGMTLGDVSRDGVDGCSQGWHPPNKTQLWDSRAGSGRETGQAGKNREDEGKLNFIS